jgi:thiosulfate reductase cytochrome b subunit
VLTIFLGIHLYLITFGDRPGFGLKSMVDGMHRQIRKK